ncbi:hypothetical protein MICAC_140001 [Microcystis aeruginosa PCC 9443]|uniref:Uncharacterized protein n=1 Tax=Microcystis aeruginosa PCC 9443 TaxID=1160281 RepID=I4FZ15_MICAE|nr:hypothetical protein MICAC_140001 [Microcystis aeruginosa PCC 9443]
MFAATNSVKKTKLTIRTPRSKFIIKLVRYAYANAPYWTVSAKIGQ